MTSRLLAVLTNAFPVWVLAGGILALFYPAWFTWFSGPWIVWGLAVIMLGMGLTLTFEDFRRVLVMPRPIALGFGAQFLVMPFLGWGIGRLLNLEPPMAVGLILVIRCYDDVLHLWRGHADATSHAILCRHHRRSGRVGVIRQHFQSRRGPRRRGGAS